MWPATRLCGKWALLARICCHNCQSMSWPWVLGQPMSALSIWAALSTCLCGKPFRALPMLYGREMILWGKRSYHSPAHPCSRGLFMFTTFTHKSLVWFLSPCLKWMSSSRWFFKILFPKCYLPSCHASFHEVPPCSCCNTTHIQNGS